MRVHLESPADRHAGAFLAAVARSRRLHRGLASPPDTQARFRVWLARAALPSQSAHLVCLEDGALAGAITLGEIVRGVFRSAYLGYYAFVPHAGSGHMTAGLRLVLARAFGRLRLHRVEANIQPRNAASIALVERLGFRLEGFSPRYLKIAGRWRDHQRWAITAEEWRRTLQPQRGRGRAGGPP